MIPEAPPIDYLGMELAVANQRITNCREIFGWTDIKPARVPMSGPTMGDFPRLNADKVAKFYTGVGFLIISWLSTTARVDIAHTWNRIGKWQAKPKRGCIRSLVPSFQILIKNPPLAAFSTIESTR